MQIQNTQMQNILPDPGTLEGIKELVRLPSTTLNDTNNETTLQ